MKLYELSMNGLGDSAIAAFPNTTRRQHATGTILIDQVRLTTFLGVKTLLCRARADNTADEGGVYRPLVLIRGVEYGEDSPGFKKITGDDGVEYFMRTIRESQVLVRCQCQDFHWRFQHEDHVASSLYGSNRKPYDASGGGPPANPQELPGYCKHLFKLGETLRDMGVLI